MARRRVRYEAGEPPPQGAEPPSQADESSVYARGQTVIPKTIREALCIEYGTRLHWEAREGVIHVIPIPKDPVKALRGFLKGSGFTFEDFLRERQRERQRERELEERQEREWSRRKAGRKPTWDTSSIPQP